MAQCSSDSPLLLQFMYVTDASGLFGACGLWAPHRCFQLQWPTTWSAVDIVVKELVPVVVTVALWGGQWHHSHVYFHIDNEEVVAIIQQQSGRGVIVQHLLRCFYFYLAFYQFCFTVEHIPGVLIVQQMHYHEIASPCSLPPVFPGSHPITSHGHVGYSAAELGLNSLDQLVHRYLNTSIAPSTASTYRFPISRYLNFCSQLQVSLLPLSQITVACFITHLAHAGLSHSSIHSYLSSLCHVRSWYVMCTRPWSSKE